MYAFLVISAQLTYAHDLILYNGTIDQDGHHAQALLLRNHVITMIGANEDIKAHAHKGAHYIDLQGRRVIPGLVDSHIHAIRAGLNYIRHIDWGEVPSLGQALDLITQTAKKTDRAWLIVAGGWNTQQFTERRRPTLAEIERAAPGRLIFIQHAYNAVLMSSAALKELELTDDGHLPKGARFELDERGERTGWIIGASPAIISLFDLLPHGSFDQHIKGTQTFFRTLNSYGLTGVIDPGGHNLSLDEYDALFSLAHHHQLNLRIAYSAFAPRPHHELSDMEHISEVLKHNSTDLMRYNGWGENIDWGFYNNDTPTHQQIAYFEEIATRAARRGERVTLHWNNDASVHYVLDVYERINAKIPLAPLRWSIAHIHDASPMTIKRIKKLGIGWLVQNAGYFASAAWLNSKGDAATTTPALASALHMGIPMGGGTDADRVMIINPFVSMRWMVDARTIDGNIGRGPEERLTREEALRIYTAGSAWFSGDEKHRGALRKGYDADIAVLNQDYMTIALEAMPRLRSVLTIVNGNIVFADGPYKDLDPTQH